MMNKKIDIKNKVNKVYKIKSSHPLFLFINTGNLFVIGQFIHASIFYLSVLKTKGEKISAQIADIKSSSITEFKN